MTDIYDTSEGITRRGGVFNPVKVISTTSLNIKNYLVQGWNYLTFTLDTEFVFFILGDEDKLATQMITFAKPILLYYFSHI